MINNDNSEIVNALQDLNATLSELLRVYKVGENARAEIALAKGRDNSSKKKVTDWYKARGIKP